MVRQLWSQITGDVDIDMAEGSCDLDTGCGFDTGEGSDGRHGNGETGRCTGREETRGKRLDGDMERGRQEGDTGREET